jgi:predicted nucleic acid-binding protein
VGQVGLPKSGSVYVDAPVVIYSVERHPDFAPRLRALWAGVRAGTLDVVTSELTIMETAVIPLRHRNDPTLKLFEAFFLQPAIRVLPVTRAVLLHAAKLRAASPKLRTPDAIQHLDVHRSRLRRPSHERCRADVRFGRQDPLGF